MEFERAVTDPDGFQRELNLALEALDREPLEPSAGLAGQEIAPGELRRGRVNAHAGDGSGFALVGPDRVAQDERLQQAAVNRLDLDGNPGAPGLEAHKLPDQETKSV